MTGLDFENGKIDVEPIGQQATEGIHEPHTFDLDPVARVWRNRELLEIADIQLGDEVQLNLTWAHGSRDREFSIADVWLDEASRQNATDRQRRRHLKFIRERWSPGRT